jgi:hypothetical protein
MTATMGKRAINVDPQDVADCDDPSLLATAVVGSVGGTTVEWSIGPIAAAVPRREVSADEAEEAVRGGAALYLCRGHNYRVYEADTSAHQPSPGEEPSEASPPDHQFVRGDEAGAPQEESGGGARSRKQYTKAVAFEFVNGVLGNVLGSTEQAEEAWAPST